jgi:very-long-chain (3R)-3-hydroxyacyl-CoA dehydratase
MSLTSKYLAVYNAASFSLWAYLAFLSLKLGPSLYAQGRLHDLYDALLYPFLTGTQSLAAIEVVHAAAGLVRASPVTTAIQVIGKNLVVWTVMVQFPEVIVGQANQDSVGIWGFLGCVVFWSLSEIIRYGYFTVLLLTGDTPSWLKWLRYVTLL